MVPASDYSISYLFSWISLILFVFNSFWLLWAYTFCFSRSASLTTDLPVGFPFQISQSAPIKAQLLVDTTHIWLLYFSHFISLILSLFNSFWLPWAYTLYNLCFARSAFLARFPWAYTSHNLCFARSAFFTRFPDRISNRESLSQPPVDLTALFFILLLSILFISSLFNSFWWLWAYSLCFSPVGIPLQISWLSRRRRY